MNLLHLKYAVEVERVGSFSGAAKNLYMAQPNLSRIIAELEDSLGIKIFERTAKGVVTTEDGSQFLNYARNILAQIDQVESVFTKRSARRLNFSVSVPRASYISKAFSETMKRLHSERKFEINFKETNSLRAINNILYANYNLGIIRYNSEFTEYFDKLILEKDLRQKLLLKFTYRLIMSQKHALASKEVICESDLNGSIEIAHGDPFVPSMSLDDVKKVEHGTLNGRHIFVYERGSQFDLLNSLTDSYMWVSAVPKEMLDRHGLVERVCADYARVHKDVLIYKKSYRFNEADTLFIGTLLSVIEKLNA